MSHLLWVAIVLILVVVEDSLWQDRYSGFNGYPIVLILVVVEDSLWQVCDSDGNESDGLNPCCSGR